MAVRRSILFPSNCSPSCVLAEHLTQEEWHAHARILQKMHKVGGFGYWQLSLTTGDMYWSDVMYEFFAVDPNNFQPGKAAFMTMVHPDDKDKVAKAWQGMLNTGFTDIKYRIVQPNGSIRWLHEIADNTSFDDPEVLLGTLHDITGYKALEEKLRKQAITDDLTGVFNRRYFMKRLRHAFSHFRRGKQSAAVLLFDVDYFKAVNDTYGHAMGDRVLQQLCYLFNERLRETDIIGRLGGEEFAVLLFELSSEDAAGVADEIRQALAAMTFTTDTGHTFHVSVTCGVANFSKEDLTEENILHRADKSLYLGKHKGRDQVIGDGDH